MLRNPGLQLATSQRRGGAEWLSLAVAPVGQSPATTRPACATSRTGSATASVASRVRVVLNRDRHSAGVTPTTLRNERRIVSTVPKPHCLATTASGVVLSSRRARARLDPHPFDETSWRRAHLLLGEACEVALAHRGALG